MDNSEVSGILQTTIILYKLKKNNFYVDLFLTSFHSLIKKLFKFAKVLRTQKTKMTLFSIIICNIGVANCY
jgi:hypothetical protein